MSTTLTVPAVPVDPELAKKVKNASARHEQWRAERDRLIVAASLAGGSTREIAELVGLSHVHVSRIVHKAIPMSRIHNPKRGQDPAEREREMKELREQFKQLYPEAFDDSSTS